MFDEQPDGNPHGECAEEITRLRADLAKVTWQRNEAQAGLAAMTKSRDAAMRIVTAKDQQMSVLRTQQDQWSEARNTLESERAANARITADLAASQAECERLSSMIDHQRDEAMEMERMLRAELADSQSECGRMTELCRRLYVELPEPVAYGIANTSITGQAHALMMVRLDIPLNDQYGGALWLPLVLADAAKQYGDAREAAGYARGLKEAVVVVSQTDVTVAKMRSGSTFWVEAP